MCYLELLGSLTLTECEKEYEGSTSRKVHVKRNENYTKYK